MDLKRRALGEVDARSSSRAAAGRFDVSVSSVIRWDEQRESDARQYAHRGCLTMFVR